MQKIIKEQVKQQVKVQVSKILPKIEQTVNEQLETEVLTRLSNSSKTSYAVAVDLSEMELKKILIKKMEGNKSIHRSNEQRNLYKDLVEAYEYDKIILDTYGDTVTLKRRRDDNADKDEEPSARPDRGSKRRREGNKPESTSAPNKKAARSAGKSTQGSIQPWISKITKKYDFDSSFNELMDTPMDFFAFLMNRLKLDTLTLELLAGPTYELKGSCKSLVELEFFLEKVYKETTDQLDWVNPEASLKSKANSTALDDRLKGIRMKYPPQTIWRKNDKDRAAAMIQAIDKQLKTRRIMRSLERSILKNLQVTPTKLGRMTKPCSSYRFIANYFNAGNLKMEVKLHLCLISNIFHCSNIALPLIVLVVSVRVLVLVLIVVTVAVVVAVAGVVVVVLVTIAISTTITTASLEEDKIPPSSSPSSLPMFSWSRFLFLKWPPTSSTKLGPDLRRWQQ
nr:hypothetical protein [Tanacetum cinerariifolium]